MVETIIEMDKQARKRTEEAEAYQRKAQEELESKEKQILSECLEQAEAEVGELVRSEEQAAEKKLKEAKAANAAAVRRMEALYKEKGAQWVRGARTPCAGGITQNEQSAWRAVFCWRERRTRCLTNPADACVPLPWPRGAIMKRTDYARRKGEPILCSQRYPPMRFWQNRAPCMAGG